jgi:hypothetical protein
MFFSVFMRRAFHGRHPNSFIHLYTQYSLTEYSATRSRWRATIYHDDSASGGRAKRQRWSASNRRSTASRRARWPASRTWRASGWT